MGRYGDVSGRLVRFDDSGLQKVYEHFEKNLDDICRIADSEEIQLNRNTH